MKKIKMIMVLGICLMFSVNAFAGRRNDYNYNSPKHNKGREVVKVVKYVPVPAYPKYAPKPKVVQKTVVVHHYEEPRYNQAAETVALVGLGIIATVAIAKAIF